MAKQYSRRGNPSREQRKRLAASINRRLKSFKLGAVVVGIGAIASIVLQQAHAVGAVYYGIIFYIIVTVFLLIIKEYNLISSSEKYGDHVHTLIVKCLNNSLSETLRRMEWPFEPFAAPAKVRWLDEIYRNGAARFTYELFIITHGYILMVIVLDAMAPGFMSFWYDLWKPLLAVQLNLSQVYHVVESEVRDLGYEKTIDFLTHVYFVPLLLILGWGGVNYRRVLTIFRVEVRNSIFRLMSRYKVPYSSDKFFNALNIKMISASALRLVILLMMVAVLIIFGPFWGDVTGIGWRHISLNPMKYPIEALLYPTIYTFTLLFFIKFLSEFISSIIVSKRSVHRFILNSSLRHGDSA